MSSGRSSSRCCPPTGLIDAVGVRRVDDRVCCKAIVFVLVTGIAWRHLPSEFECSPATAHTPARCQAASRGVGAPAR
jgi:transposase